MRLIDADALNEAMYRKSFETDDGRQRWDGGLWIRYKVFEEARDEAPTVNATPVVRCSYCKFFKEEEEGGECGITDIWMSDNDYCSLAERIGNHETD